MSTLEPRWAARPSPCMGGWCGHRDNCAHHHAEHRQEPAERLCAKGEERPLRWVDTVQPRERIAA